MQRLALSVLVLASFAAFATDARAVLPPQYTSIRGVGTIPSFPNFNGWTFKNDDPNTILFWSANNIYSVGITRDSGFHMTGFDGTPTVFASAPATGSGGGVLAYGPNGVLFASSAGNVITQYKPGSTTPDKSFTPTGVTLGNQFGSPFLTDFALNPYTPNKGILAIRASPNDGAIYDTTLVPDGNGTFDFVLGQGFYPVSANAADYMPINIPYLPSQSQPQLWVGRGTNGWGPWLTNSAGLPIGGYGTYDNTYGGPANFDPLTGDYIYQYSNFSQFLNVVTTIPEPTGLASAGAVASLALLRRRR